MSHLRLVPPPARHAAERASQRASEPAAERPGTAWISAPAAPAIPAPRAPLAAYDDPTVVALSFFQSASGLCLCRACSMKRHPAFAGR